MTVEDFVNVIKGYEGRLAPGSETPLLGYFRDRLLTLDLLGDDHLEDEMPAAEAEWWIRAYDLYVADQAKPRPDQADDIQAIFNAC